MNEHRKQRRHKKETLRRLRRRRAEVEGYIKRLSEVLAALDRGDPEPAKELAASSIEKNKGLLEKIDGEIALMKADLEAPATAGEGTPSGMEQRP